MKLLCILLLIAVCCQTVFSVVVEDHFSDNAMGSLWTLYEPNPSSCWADETNARLEFRATGSPTDEQVAGYVSTLKLSPYSDFRMRLYFYYSKVTVADGGLNITLFPEVGEYFQVGVGCDDNQPYMGYKIVGTVNDEDGVARPSDSGTVYLSYTSSTDTLHISVSGYSSGDALDYPGLLQGTWGGADLWIGLFGFSSGVAISSGQAYADDFVLDEGTLAISQTSDNFASAITLSGVSGQTTGSNYNMTKETGEPHHAGYFGGASAWWKWTATSNGTVTIDTIGSTFDTLLGIYTGSAVGSLTNIASDDESGGNSCSSVTFVAVSGTTYRIAVDGYSAETGDIVLNWDMNITSDKTISGTARTSGGSVIPDVTIAAGSGGGSATTSASGVYTLLVPTNWTGTITATKNGYTFPSRNYSTPVTSNRTAQDFTSDSILTDNFNDNSMNSCWGLGIVADGCDESDFALNETNGRLEYSATLPPVYGDDYNLGVALYYSNQWWLDVSQDFAFKIQYHNPQTTGIAELALGLTPWTVNPDEIDLYIYISADSWEEQDYAKGYYFERDDGTPLDADRVERTTNDGTLYISYDSVLDELYLSYTGYGPENSWKIVSGILNGTWGGIPIYPGFGGVAYDGTTVNPATLYLDNFVLDAGEIVLPTNEPCVPPPDFDGDGTTDLLWQNNSTSANFITMVNNGVRSPFQYIADSAGGALEIMKLGDFNGDGTTDLLWEKPSTSANFITIINNGVRSPFQYIANSAGGALEIVDLGDFNGDDTTDLLWQNTSTSANFITMVTNGVRSPFQYIPDSSGGGLEIVDLGDFNGDGTTDMLWENTATSANFITLITNGVRGSFQYIADSSGGLLEIVDLGDFNGDGTTDLLWQNTSTSANFITMITAGVRGSFQFVPDSTGGVLEIVDLGDFNGDGTTDMLWENTATSANYIALIENGVRGSLQFLADSTGGTLEVVDAGDFNGDDTTDLLWENLSTHAKYITLIDNGVRGQFRYIANSKGTTLEILDLAD